MKTIRVLVIDDSAFNRRTISRILEGIPGVEVAGYAVDGEEGIRRFLELKPDLVTLDLEMPRMDGFTLLRIIMKNNPVPVIVVSSLGGDERVFRALELGAVDFILKPTADASDVLNSIRDDLTEKVQGVFNLNMSSIRKRGEALPVATAKRTRAEITRHRDRQGTISILAIGASTGGPPALQVIFEELPGDIPFSIVVSQHMPAGFTRAFAERLNRIAAITVIEASDGDPVRCGTALVAPGGRNMVFQQSDGEVRVRLLEPQVTDHCIPSVDRMFQSCAEIFGPRMLGVVLTGMGSDGSRGVRAIKEAGGQVVSESEETAVIFGMPRAAIATGMVDAVVPLEKISEEIMTRCGTGGDRS